MDSYREQPSDFDLPSAAEASAQDVATAIGTDERRMHVRAYNYWVSLLDGRDFPSIEDLEPADLNDFAPHSVLLDFTCGRDNPALPYVGLAIRDECALSDDIRAIADVPSRSLLSRLTDHYLQIIANRAPVGFEAEFDNPRGETICYRGILMPFSSDGDTIDFIYGVINWKRVAASGAKQPLSAQLPPVAEHETAAELADPAAASEDVDEVPLIEPEPKLGQHQREPAAEAEEFHPAINADQAEPVVAPAPAPAVNVAWEDGPLADSDSDGFPEIAVDADAGLADRLWAARETAESVKAGEGRTRASLYRALSLAYDFAVAAQANPDEYAELLEESGVKAQARAPMTPIVKLVFGINYDKARLTEFAAALAFAERQPVTLGGFHEFIDKQPGGLKALVAAERQARRPETAADTKSEAARARLRTVAAITLADVPGENEFAVVVTRRGPDGRHEPVAIVDDEALLERAIRQAG